MIDEYLKLAESYDLYSIIGCDIRATKEEIKDKAIFIIKNSHPDRNKEGDYFSLVNYSRKILQSELTRKIYDTMGHRGLKIFYNNIDAFEKIKREFHSKILEDQQSQEFYEFLYLVLKKLKALELELIKLSFRKLLNSKQEIIQKYDASKYFNKNHEIEVNYNTDIVKKEQKNPKYLKVIDNKTMSISKSADANIERNKSMSDIKKKYEKLGFYELTPLSKIQLQNTHNFIFKEYNTLVKLNSQALYILESKRINIFKNVKIFTNFKNNIENKITFNNLKNRLEDSIYTSYFSRFHNFFQKSYARLSFKYNKNQESLRLFLGNIYVDNSYLFKSKACIGEKPKINLKYIVSIDESKNSKVEFKTRNLDYLISNYKVNLNNSICLSLGNEFYYKKKLNSNIELSYSYSKDFIISITSCFGFKFQNEKKLKNKINFGFNFSGFKFFIPIYFSKYDNKSSFFELFFVNAMTNIAGYFCNFLYKKMFSDNVEFD